MFTVEIKVGDKGCEVILVVTFMGDSTVRSFELFRKKCLSFLVS